MLKPSPQVHVVLPFLCTGAGKTHVVPAMFPENVNSSGQNPFKVQNINRNKPLFHFYSVSLLSLLSFLSRCSSFSSLALFRRTPTKKIMSPTIPPNIHIRHTLRFAVFFVSTGAALQCQRLTFLRS